MKKFVLSLCSVACLLGMSSAYAKMDFDTVEIKPEQVTNSVYMLTGYGGNIGVSAGEDGILIIDDQFAPLADKISTALKDIANTKLRYIVNTHFHGDHTGGNGEMKHHHDATVFAHDNVRVRLQNDPEQKPGNLPVVTYADGVKFHFNGDVLHVKHLPGAHTDGDSYVIFEKQNVLHTGDIMFNYMFPYIDLGAGGSVPGYIKGVEALLGEINDETKVMPGHGKLASKKDVEAFLDMLKSTRQLVMDMKSEGMTLEQVTEKGLGEKWQSWSWSFIPEAKWIATLYDGR